MGARVEAGTPVRRPVCHPFDSDQEYSSGAGEEESDFRYSLKVDPAGFWTDWMEGVRKCGEESRVNTACLA